MNKIIIVIHVIAAAAIFSCGDMADDIKKADSQDREVLRWDTGKWEQSEWGR